MIRRLNGEEKPKIVNNKSKAYNTFAAGKPTIEVASLFGIGSEEVKR